MVTLDIRYKANDESQQAIWQYRRQTTSCNRVFYNMMTEDKERDEFQSQFNYQKKESLLMKRFSQMNNVELVNSYLVQCCIVKSRAMVKSVDEIKKLDEQRREVFVSQIESLNNKIKKLTNSKKDNYKKEKLQKKISKKQSQITAIDNKNYHIVWGSKQFMRDYVSQQRKLRNNEECKAQHIITKEELEDARLDGIYVVGEALKHGNRFCRLTEDLKQIEICFDRLKPRKQRFNIVLDLIYDSNDYKEILKNLYHMQQQKLLAITYNI